MQLPPHADVIVRRGVRGQHNDGVLSACFDWPATTILATIPLKAE
jgi:hypothetical protein